MMEKPDILTLRESWPRPTPDQIAAFRGVPASLVSDAMGGVGALSKDISPLPIAGAAHHVAGPAVTAENQPGGIVGTLAALHLAQPGDVAVISVAGCQTMAALGDRVAGMLANAGAVGIVTDGPVRDIDGLDQVGLPVWATGLTPATPFDNGPARAGLPMVMAGQQIAPGDMIVADRDGVVVVPLDRVAEIAAKLPEVRALEDAMDAQVRDGLIVPEAFAEFLTTDAVKRV